MVFFVDLHESACEQLTAWRAPEPLITGLIWHSAVDQYARPNGPWKRRNVVARKMPRAEAKPRPSPASTKTPEGSMANRIQEKEDKERKDRGAAGLPLQDEQARWEAAVPTNNPGNKCALGQKNIYCNL